MVSICIERLWFEFNNDNLFLDNLLWELQQLQAEVYFNKINSRFNFFVDAIFRLAVPIIAYLNPSMESSGQQN